MTDYISKITTENGTQAIGGSNFDDKTVLPYSYNYVLLDNFTFNSDWERTFSLANYLPNDGYDYEIVIQARLNTGTTAGNTAGFAVLSGSNSAEQVYTRLSRAVTRTNGRYKTSYSNARIIISANDRNVTVEAIDTNATSGTCWLQLSSYKRLGKNGTQNDYIENINIDEDSFYQPNIEVIGDLVNNDGVISGFSQKNSAIIPNGKQNNSEYCFKFHTPSSFTKEENILHSENFVTLATTTEGMLYCYNWSTDTKINLFTAQSNTDYWVKFTVSNTTKAFSYSTDGVNFTSLTSFADSGMDITNSYELVLGNSSFINHQHRYFSGSVDLKECYIKVNNSIFWNGYVNGVKNNLTFGGAVFSGNFVTIPDSQRVLLSSVSIASGGTLEVSLLNILPNDGYDYLVDFTMITITGATVGNGSIMYIKEKGGSYHIPVCGINNTTGIADKNSGNARVRVGSSRAVILWNNGNTQSNNYLYAVRYRREGTNDSVNNSYLEKLNDKYIGGDFADGQFVKKLGYYYVYQDTFNANQTKTYTITNFLPDNKNYYEIFWSHYGRSNTTRGNAIQLAAQVSGDGQVFLSQGMTNIANASSPNSTNGTFIAKQNSNGNITITVRNTAAYTTGMCGLMLTGYRKVGNNK